MKTTHALAFLLALGVAACRVTVTEVKQPPPPPPPQPAPASAQLEIAGDIEYEKDSAVILDSFKSRAILENVRKTMQDRPSIQKLRIEGHTDSDGSDEHNMELSKGRAGAVKTWLVGKGIDGARMDAVGCGAKDPIVPNTTPENKARNRRTEFYVEQMDGKAPAGAVAPCHAGHPRF